MTLVPLIAGNSHAADWKFVPSVEVGETYNDNVNLLPKGQEQADFITSVTPGFNLAATGGRLNLNLNYSPQLEIFARGTASNGVNQQLLGIGKAEIYPEAVFLETNASVSRQFVSPTGGVANTTLTGSNNAQTVQTYDIAPVFRHHFGSYADTESRYRFGTTMVGGNQVAPVNTQEFLQKATSGQYFGVLNWTLTANSTRSTTGQVSGDPLSNTKTKDDLLRADGSYPLYLGLTGFSAIGGFGYERSVSPTLTTSTSNGAVWDAGLQYQPSASTVAHLTYGHSITGPTLDFGANYDLGPQTHIVASYTNSVQSVSSLFSQTLARLVFNPHGANTCTDGQTIFRCDALPFSVFGLNTATFVDKRASLTATATRLRNTYFLTVFNESRRTDTPPTDEKIFGGTITWSRQLWPDLSSNLGATYTHDNIGDGTGRVDQIYEFNAGLSYTLSPTATATVSLSRTDRRSNAAGGALTDDIVALLVHKNF